MLSETCSRCGEEVRYGKRGNVTGWLHRLDVDHAPILGTIRTPEMLAEDERQSHLVRERVNDAGETVTYTAHSFGLKGDAAKAARLEEGAVDVEIPDPELRSTPVTADEFPPRSGIRQIANLVAKQGWDLARFTKARGPYLGADGSVLSISDSVVLGARGPVQLDGTQRVAVASWRDGKFDSAYVGILEHGQITTTGANATELKDWIKGNSEPPDAMPPAGE